MDYPNNNHRWCIVTSPRSGSQWCERIVYQHLIKTTQHLMTVSLSEMFEPYTVFDQYFLDEEGYLNHKWGTYDDLQRAQIESKLNKGLHTDYLSRLNLIKQAHPDQPMVLRLFTRPFRSKQQEIQVVQGLLEAGFKIIGLTRNFEDCVLSYLLAEAASRERRRNIWIMGSQLESEKFYVDMKKINVNHICVSRFITTIFWKDIVNTLTGNTDWHLVNYETMLEDLNSVFENPVTDIVGVSKTLAKNPYTYIENADEIKAIVDNFKNKINKFQST